MTDGEEVVNPIRYLNTAADDQPQQAEEEEDEEIGHGPTLPSLVI
jgi:hypothetical protein